MTSQGLAGLMLGAALLICLGLLLGWVLTIQALQPKLRQQAKERHRLNEEWMALRAARSRLREDRSDDDLHGGIAVVDPSDSPAVLSSARTGSDPINAGASGPSAGSRQKSRTGGKPRSAVAREQGSGKDILVETTVPITIYLSDESAHEEIQTAVEDLLAVVGGHIDHRDDPVLGSWFRRMRARIGQAVHSPLARETAALTAHAVESRLVHAQDAAVTATMLQNLGPVIAALQSTKEAVIRAGALLIVKTDSTLVIHQLTPAQQLRLDHQPQLAQSAHDILSALELQPGNSTQSAEGAPGGSTRPAQSLNGDPAPLIIMSNNGEGPTPLNAADHQVFPEASEA